MYLHSLVVRPKDIVRLSGDPLIQDSLNVPVVVTNVTILTDFVILKMPAPCGVITISGNTELLFVWKIMWLLRESWIRGCPDGRTMTFGRTPGLRRYKIEDSVLCPNGTFLGVEGKLGDTI